ncbi:MAG: transcription elongation factor GreA [Dehalococcoidales bacterium]|nr:transcription elongation factor GreA [Dehalococcoidales bacterium]
MNGESKNPGLGEAASLFLADLAPEEKNLSQQEVARFVRWFGREHPLAGLTAAEVSNYAEQLSFSDAGGDRKLDLVRAFLAYAKKRGWSKTNLATYLKPRKGKTKSASPARLSPVESIALTRQGYAALEAELAELQSERLKVIAEIHAAAADKDFRENAPLQAAKERQGHVVGRIRELERELKSAKIVDEKRVEHTLRVNIGNSVLVLNLDSGEELIYTLVSSREVDPANGKVSTASPIGKAISGKAEGTKVEIVVPAGKLRYQIKRIER